MHLSRHNAPKGWPMPRKLTKFITRPSPGPHPLKGCIPLNLVLRDILHQGSRTREIQKILHDKNILIDKKVRKNKKFPVGLFDVVELPKLNLVYRIFRDNKGKYITHSIKSQESEIKPCKVIKKTILKKGKIQLNLFDGKNILTDNKKINVNDSVLVDLNKNMVTSHLSSGKGAKVYITDGKYQGNVGIIEEIKEDINPSRVIFSIGKEKYETAKNYAFVIDRITLPNEK